MKRPIDPNLENLIDDTIFSDDDMLKESTDEEKNDLTLSGDDGVTAKAQNDNAAMKLETVEKASEHHHHHHHHHSSKGSEHHHSSSHSSGSSHSHSHSHSSSSHDNKKKKKMSVAAKIALVVFLIILIVIFAAVFTFIYLESRGKNDLKDVSQAPAPYEEVIEYNGEAYAYNEDIVAIAFIGVDKRDLGLDNGVIGTAGQADTDIVMTVDTSTGRAKAIAVPRDTMVDVDLYSESGIFLRSENMQLCLSYAYGNGTDTSAQNVTTSLSRILYNVPISKYFVLDLNGIEPINDAIGGVTLTSLYDLPAHSIKKGDTIHLEGDLTEAYVRTRNFDTVDASLNRTARQVQYIKAFTAQLVPAIMQDFSVVNKLYSTASKYSTTNISLSNATYLASFLVSKGVTEFETVTLEGEMKASDKIDYKDYVYAEFYPDSDKLMEVVLDTFYKKQTK